MVWSLSQFRSLASISLLALAFFASAQDTTKKISLDVPGLPVPLAIKMLAESSGVKLEASTTFNNTPIILSLKDRTVQETMDKIAAAVLGKWIKKDFGFRLENDKDAWSALQSISYAKRKVAIGTALSGYLKSHENDTKWDANRVRSLIADEKREQAEMLDNLRKGNPDFDSSNVFISKGSSRKPSPATPALLEVVRRISPDQLASVAPGQRIVFSSSPNTLQKPFPFNSAGIIDKFVESHNLLAELDKSNERSPSNVTVRGGIDLNAKPLSTALSKMLVILTRKSNASAVNIDIKLSDQSGSIVGSASCSLVPDLSDTTQTMAFESKSDSMLTFSPLASELAKAFVETNELQSGGSNVMVMRNDGGAFRVSSNGPTPIAPLTSAAVAAITDPVKVDPQSTFVAEGLIAAAKASNRDLVCAIGDRTIVPLARSTVKNPKPQDFLQAASKGGADVSEKDGWLILVPKDRLTEVGYQMNRAACKKLFADEQYKGYVRLQQLAQYIQSMGAYSYVGNFGIVTLGVIDPYAAEDARNYIQESPNLIQLIGTLDNSVFSNVARTFSLGVISLTPEQKGYVDRFIYGADSQGGIFGEGDMMSIGISNGPDQAPTPKGPMLSDDPTESMPNGLPMKAQIQFKFTPRDLVRAHVKGRRGGQFVSAADLGSQLGFKEKVDSNDLATKIPMFDSFVASQGVGIELSMATFNREANHNFSDAWTVPDSLPVTYNALSQAFRDEVTKAREQMNNNSVTFGPTRGQKPPQ